MLEPGDIDRDIKALVRLRPDALFRLAGIDTHGLPIFPEDVQVDQPQHDADSVFRIGGDNDPGGWALHLEFQLQPDQRELRRWMFKNAGLSLQLDRPVVLLVLYLHRGKRRSFPSECVTRAGGLETRFSFTTIRLWEHADRIRSGDLAALAPLLVLCEDNPTLETLEVERDLILHHPGFAHHERADLMAIAAGMAKRYFTMDALRQVFQKEDVMLLKETEWVQEWIQETRESTNLDARRDDVREALEGKFGELPDTVLERIRESDVARCRSIIRRIGNAGSLAELGLE